MGKSFLGARLFCGYGGVNEEIIRRYVRHQDKKELEQEQQLELLRD